MKLLFTLLLGLVALVSSQRGDVEFFEDDSDKSWNVHDDNWGGWRGDNPAWQEVSGPVVHATPFEIQSPPLYNSFEISPPFIGQPEVGHDHGFVKHVGKYCKVIKGYGGRQQQAYPTYPQINGYYGNDNHISADYQSTYPLGGTTGNIGSIGSIGSQFYQNSLTSVSNSPSQNGAFSSGYIAGGSALSQTALPSASIGSNYQPITGTAGLPNGLPLGSVGGGSFPVIGSSSSVGGFSNPLAASSYHGNDNSYH